MTSVAVLGLGAMGSRMASRLAEAGHDVIIWNRTGEVAAQLAGSIGSQAADTAREAASSAEVVIAMVADDDASRSVWLDEETGVLDSLTPTAVAIESSTITRAHAIRLGDAANTRGRAFIEAPVVGSRPQAEAGALFVLAGGDSSTVDQVRPVLDSYAGGVRHVGPVGQAAAAKLAINGLFGVQVAAYAEIVGMLGRVGFSLEEATALLSGLPITSPGLVRILGLFAERNFSPNFPVALVAKDLRYLQVLAKSVGAAVPVAAAGGSVFDDGSVGGQATLDIAGIAERYLSETSSPGHAADQ